MLIFITNNLDLPLIYGEKDKDINKHLNLKSFTSSCTNFILCTLSHFCNQSLYRTIFYLYFYK